MDFDTFERLLKQSFARNGIREPDRAESEQFFLLAARLISENEKYNLTAIKSTEDIISKHFADSLIGNEQIPQGSLVLDMGCGAGFPTFPLAILRKDLRLISLDATAKKIGFVRETAKELSLGQIKAVAGRAEDANIRAEIGLVDAVVSRAMARLNILAELSLPYLKVGGILLALKGAKGAQEAEEAKSGAAILRGRIESVTADELFVDEESAEQRCLIRVVKTGQTPSRYPRSYAQILKKPL